MLGAVLRLFFRLLYREFAFAYDSVSYAVSLGHWRRWQRCVLPYLAFARKGVVLELAHGTGDLQLDLQRANYRTAALDISPQMGRITGSKLRRAGLPARLVRASVFNIPLASSSVTAAVCSFPTAFIFDPQTLAELRRVLTPGGCAIYVLAGQLDGGGPLRWLIRALYRLTGQGQRPLTTGDHISAFGGCGLKARAEIVRCDGSAAQLLLLKKTGELTASPKQIAG